MNKLHPEEKVAIFEGRNIRRVWDGEKERWFFSVVDIVGVLTEQENFQKSRKYWNKLSERLKTEGSQVVTNCHRLKMVAEDGKLRETDVADTETVFRLIQSVPSSKAEPIKLWLAKVGHERILDISDPERSVNRGREYWQKMGRGEKWIQQRMMGQETRNKLTDYWATHDVKKNEEFAILTNLIHEEWTGLTVKKHKEYKSLKTQNLRDHMSEAELIFTALAELSTREIAETVEATGFGENKEPAIKGGRIAKNARIELEEKTGKSVVTSMNFLGQKKNVDLDSGSSPE
ncbi:hypothetical protein COT86_00225 [Candidatus Collierbacteria bacterium CG10_big_fil_rev_8_21_14_0_10_43_36]|uniref:Bro-N domain-containing protein n=1 Tax=Candidatus Collierbacteria bacterium CG10_big_fil_rev_8_21_14_0_10_43_36 TaxID=1974534 RepID=A0A2H0VM19_9BACT|nr:MAG: hypothetical protein COT86_00225 [Candidatus Collierbacteria bacterium CG10_big_fil_rev_8_21_14_0_10_43_36]